VIVFAINVAATTLPAGLVSALALTLLPTANLRLAGLALVSVALPLAAVAVSGTVMFSSGHDMTLLFVAAASSSAAVFAGLVVARSIAGPVKRLRKASSRLATGDLSTRAPESGPRELAELGASFNEMAANLQRLFDIRSQLVAWASHDLRTPLASLQAMLEALEDGLAEPEQYVSSLREQVRLLAMIVDDLFEPSRIDAGGLTLDLTEARLDPLVEARLRGVESEARARQITLDADLDGAAPVLCAPEKVERVLYNLLANALRHMPNDGSVAVRVRPLANEVCVTVEDTGAGFRAESARGSGLGLAIARGFVEHEGGRFWQENRPGGGARISFTLPVAA
jgi:signal transduction histidine kinase